MTTNSSGKRRVRLLLLFFGLSILECTAAACSPAAAPPAPMPLTQLLPTQLATVVLPTSTPIPAPSTPTSMPLTGLAAVIKNYFDARNAKNVDAAMAFFADDAVYTNHFGAKYVGKTEIRSLVQHDADENQQFEMSNVQVAGSKVTYHLKIYMGRNPSSEYDFDAVIQGDKITAVTAH